MGKTTQKQGGKKGEGEEKRRQGRKQTRGDGEERGKWERMGGKSKGLPRERGGWDNRTKGRSCALWVHWVASRILWGVVLLEVTERFGG